MPKLRRLSGKEVVAIFVKFSFVVVSQKGSHMKLKREYQGHSQTLTIPAHSELDTGTLRAIVRQATRFIPAEELQPYFFS